MSTQTGTPLTAEEKRRRLAELLRRKASGPRTYPASLQQRRLWFMDQLEPGSPAYNMLFGVRFKGPLDVDALGRALEELVRRHEALRTRFELRGDEPVQVVDAAVPVRVRVEEDFSHLEDEGADPTKDDEEEKAWYAPMRDFLRRPFDLAAGPLFRVKLMRLSPDRHVLGVAMHHTIMDGWSLKVMFDELNALYHAFIRGEPSPLPPVPLQYGDFAAWQRRHLSEERLAEQAEYWRGALAGIPTLIELPADRPRPPVQSYEGDAVQHEVSADVWGRLERIGREQGATDFMVTLAAFAVLVSRLTGEERIVFGTPIAGRVRPELEPVVGYFANTMALPVDVSGDPTFRELVGRVKETTLGAYAHQEMPFERLVEALEVERSLGHNPVYQVMFTYQVLRARMEEEDVPEGGVHLKPAVPPSKAVIADLNVVFQADEDDGTLFSQYDYRTDLFDEETAERWGDLFDVLAGGIAADPDRPVSAYPLLDGEARETLVRGFNESAGPAPEAEPLHRLWERQVERTPERDAIAWGAERVSYRDLDARANRIAHHLVSLGVGPEERVAVSLPRTPDLIAALLGVLKAGGAYLPVDPAYPSERIRYLLEDSGARVVLTTSEVAAGLPETAARAVPLDALDLSGLPADPPAVEVEPASIAYCIYTSGSTGRPKAVAVEHRCTTPLLHWLRDALTDEERSGALGSTSVSFDVSVGEIFGCLCWGGTLVLVENALALAELGPEAPPVRYVSTVPSAAAELVRIGGVPETVRSWGLCGEPLPLALARDLYGRAGAERVLNIYGPTEDTVYSSWAEIPDDAERILIGTALPGTRMYVLDGRMEPAPTGVPGELWLAGAGVTRGYWGRPGLTAERFVPDPFSTEPGARMYRTGDRARWMREGAVEHLGRVDHQVKVRGYRIELGEIAAALRAQDGVDDAVAAVVEVVPGDSRLIGYVVGDGAPEPGALRDALRATLPEHMIPAAVLKLDALPTMPNGKVDRRALPKPDFGADVDRFVAPRTATEEAVAEVWREVLGLERVGVHDDFFGVGGHSLAATRLISRVSAAFGVQLPVRVVFEAPNVESMAARVDAALREDAVASAPPLVRVERDGPVPLSFAQERLWFVDRMLPGSAAYNIPMPIPVGAAEPEAVARALAEVVRRHEALRTTFRAEGDEVRQVIHPAPETFSLPVVDLTTLPEEERGAEAGRLVAEEAGTPFDLEEGPLLRAVLFRLSDDEQVLLANVHHVVSDAWSMQVLAREVDALIRAIERGEASPLAELPVQYADYAVWQREWLSGEELERQLAFWRGALADAPSVLELPTDRPRPAVQSYDGAMQGFAIPAEVAAGLHALARREGTTLFMVLLAAFDVLLSRWSGQDDVVVGSPVAGRVRPEVEPLIGFFVNNLVLRTDLSGDPSFRELLARVKEATLGAYAHQDVPFEKLVDELEVERSLSHSPLFQVVFNLLNTPPSGLGSVGTMPDVLTEPQPRPSKFDLNVEVHELGDALWVAVEYATSLFDHATATRLAMQLRALLPAVAEAPGTPVSAFDLTEADERRLLLAERAGRTTEYPRTETVASLFRARAAETPGATAVEFAGETLTYAELDARTERLARHLLDSGVEPGDRVGLAMPRSLDVPVAVLAIVKAGAAYVPLDAGYPAERLRFMAEDSGISTLLVADDVPEALADLDLPVVSLSADAERIAGLPADAVGAPVFPDSLAYVVYTSGSTGQPKGVAVPHRAVVRLVKETDFISFSADETFLQLAPVAFDASTLELWGPLLNGGRLVVFPPETPSLEDLGRFLVDREVTTLWLTAGLFHQMVDAQLDAFAGVRQLLAGGDVLSPSHVKRVLDAHPELTLVNGYGPTESTTFTTTRRITRDDVERATVPIGEPIANTYVRILDDAMRPVPVGVPGELYVGGDGLAWGYVDRPALTAERFVPDPYAETEGARLYATGDRVRWLADGSVEFLGRTDQQVKVRGYRIEPGEIETALAAHPRVGQALVVARADGAAEKRLVGYVVPVDGVSVDEIDADSLRAHLAPRLPGYMVPGAFVALESLPLTANGKVDRRALPAPEYTGADEHVAPRTETERAVAEIWGRVLGVEDVGARDDFFAAGGHSLAATRVVSQLRRTFGVEVPLRALFEAPTVEALAARVDDELRKDATSSQPPLVPVERDGPAPMSFAQERLWFVDRLAPDTAAYNVAFTVDVGDAAPEVVAKALAEIVRRHEALRTTFAPGEGGGAMQVIHPAPDAFDLPVDDLTRLPEDERAAEAGRIVREDAGTPFDLERGPLLRARLIRLSDDEQVLLVDVHHVVSDGWSTGVFGREMAALLDAFSKGEPSPLPPLPVQYADYAVWQRRWLSGDELERQLAYWRDELAGVPAHLELPTDRPRPPAQTFVGASRMLLLPAELRDELHVLARGENATLFMVLLAAFDVLLSRWSGQEDVVVGSPVAGRNRAETEPLIGFFVNNLVLRADLSDDPTFRALLARAREATLGAYAHQDIPFEKLVEELEVERSLAHTPLFQVVFNLLTEETGASGAGAGIPEGRTEWSSDYDQAKYDLNLTAQETERGIILALTYNVDLFEEETVARMLRHLRALVEAAVERPDARVSEFEVLSGDERTTLVEQWNDTSAASPSEPAHVLFAAQVEKTPDAPALVFGGESVSYADLDARANRLARHLTTLGVGRDVPVAISLPRSPEMVVALLAAMKAGGAYLPVDPTYPAERRRWMLEDSGAPVVLTLSSLVDDLPATDAKTVLLDEIDLSSVSSDAPSTDVSSDDLAYVIYTSGSTGKPKGVAVTHRGIGNLITAQGDAFGIEPGTRVLQFASFSFDAAVSEVLVTLLNGGVLHLATQDEMQPGEPLLRTLREGRIEVVTLPPSVLSVMPPDGLDDLRTIVSAGEACSAELVKTWSAGGRRFVNAYGPTETTVCATMAVDLTAEDVEDSATVPIGGPIRNVRVYVLDGRMRPVPVGVPGELYVGGPGVARGYLNRAELTSEKFVDDPFSEDDDGGEKPRLYRTGDRVRWTAEGALEFLGRLDEQVKVRGFRIELGEIEAALRAQENVADAVVLARTDLGAEPTLVGYAVAAGEAQLDGASLQAALRERLPGFMVPAAIVVLDALPTTPNGKVDRRALPRPDLAAGAEYVAPRTPTEEALAEIWSEVLGVDREKVGAETDFFAAGGHSLAATQVIARIRQRFGVELPLRALFEASTVAALAERLDAAKPAAGEAAEAAPARPTIGRISRASRGGGLTLDDD